MVGGELGAAGRSGEAQEGGPALRHQEAQLLPGEGGDQEGFSA